MDTYYFRPSSQSTFASPIETMKRVHSPVPGERIWYIAPSSMTEALLAHVETIPVPAVASASDTSSSTDALVDDKTLCDCTICLESLSSDHCLQFKACRHAFHSSCLQKIKEPKCPICRTTDQPQGKCPSGTLKISHLSTPCPGFNGTTTIQLDYNIPPGTQLPYHEHPGHRYHGTTRTAYLPESEKNLLARLKFAFRHGLTFTVGRSLTTDRENQVVWTSIHHKTSLHGGTHGFPDSNYIQNCHGSLTALGVPVQVAPDNDKVIRYQAPPTLTHKLKDMVEPYVAPVPVPPPPCAPAAASASRPASVVGPNDLSVKPSAPPDSPGTEVLQPKAPLNEDCAICLDDLSKRSCLKVKRCHHIFHEDCLKDSLEKKLQCPVCRAAIPLCGKCPSGSMDITVSSYACPGFNGANAIEIKYTIEAGIQADFHPTPGYSFPETCRVTYLPDTNEGRQLLQRIKEGFLRGLIFSVGTSLTSGKSNVVVWNSAIPHKTSLNGGAFGFPDANYIQACNQALDAVL